MIKYTALSNTKLSDVRRKPRSEENNHQLLAKQSVANGSIYIMHFAALRIYKEVHTSTSRLR